MGSGLVAPPNLYLGTRWRWLQLTPHLLQSWSGHGDDEENCQPYPGIEPCPSSP